MSLDQCLELFFGASSDAATHVYARAPRPNLDDVRLTGSITGPFCRGTRTLPLTTSFQDLGPGPTLLARAIVPEMAPWLADQPHLYRVRLELAVGPSSIERTEREWSVHRFGVKHDHFVWNAKRWVLRGVAGIRQNSALEDWHTHAATAVVVNPDEALCAEASRMGVALLAIVEDDSANIWRQIKRLARWPAVLVAVVDRAWQPQESVKEAVPNLVVATRVHSLTEAPPWANAVLLDELTLASAAAITIPVIATRKHDGLSDIATSRAECDRLQRDLAAIGQFAGYVVW